MVGEARCAFSAVSVEAFSEGIVLNV